MASSDLVSQREAAAILNRSVTAVSRALREGRLTYADPERRLLHRPGLEQRFARTTRSRIDAPQRKAQMEAMHHDSQPLPTSSRPELPPIKTDYWQRLTDKLSCVLDGAPAYWQREPNSAQLRLFCRTLDELRSQVEAEGLEPQ